MNFHGEEGMKPDFSPFLPSTDISSHYSLPSILYPTPSPLPIQYLLRVGSVIAFMVV